MHSSNSSNQPSTDSPPGKSPGTGQGTARAGNSIPDKFLGGVVDFFTSLRLTVVCLLFACLLVLLGTLAQVELGLYRAQEEYFRSFFVFWGPAGATWKIPILPGGYLVGGLLLLNLVASLFSGSSKGRRGAGIWLIHLGLILLLVGQLLTDLLSVESAMQLSEGESKNYSQAFRELELAVADTSSPESDLVYSISGHRLTATGAVSSRVLPFRVEVRRYWSNAGLVQAGTAGAAAQKGVASGATAGELREVLVVPQSLSRNMDERNTPAAVVEFFDGTASAGAFLVSPMAMHPQQFTLGGKSYEVSMRYTRYYYPFTITLLKATHEKYKGTEIPKNFASRVRIDNSVTGETRETVIKMNTPLRYTGQTFYQYQMSAGEMAQRQGMTPSSTFQVVRNPGWLTPYLSTVLVSLGLMVQFGAHLIGFVRRKMV